MIIIISDYIAGQVKAHHAENRMKYLNLSFVMIILLMEATLSIAHNGAKYEPPNGKIYHGVGWQTQAQNEYAEMFSDSTQPLLFQVMSALPGYMRRGGMTVNNLLSAFRQEHIDQRSQYIELSTHLFLDDEPIDNEFVETDRYDGYIDTLAIALAEYGRPVFLRIGLEMNGSWNGYTPYVFPVAFRKLVTGLRDRDVENFAAVWCYEPDAPADFADSSRQGWRWYPGDDVVDWFGLDPFDVDHFDPDEPDSVETRGGWGLSKKGRTEKFLRFAEERGKPVYLNELSARHVWITPYDEDVDSTHGEVDWNYWFAPFFEFLDDHPNIKAFNYINLDWTRYETWEHWGEARLQINDYIEEHWVQRLSSDRFLHAGYDVEQHLTAPFKSVVMPTKFQLTVYPNPFNSVLHIEYYLQSGEDVSFELLDLTGRLLWTNSHGFRTAGSHHAYLNGNNIPSGQYQLRLNSTGAQHLRKITLIR